MRSARIPLAVLGLILFGGPAAAAAQEPLPIPGAGIMGDIPGAHEQPDPALDYRIVFDVQTLAASPEQVDPALQAMARLINTFRHGGVTPSHLHLEAMFHGGTVAVVANDGEYARRMRVRNNPNVVLLRQLQDAGVVLAVCGQSAKAQGYAEASLLPLVQWNLSATVTFVNLAMRGYVRIAE